MKPKDKIRFILEGMGGIYDIAPEVSRKPNETTFKYWKPIRVDVQATWNDVANVLNKAISNYEKNKTPHR